MTILKFKGMTVGDKRKFIVLAIIITLIPTIVLMTYVINFNVRLSPFQVKMYLLIAALTILAVFPFIVKTLIRSNQYEIIFDYDNLTIKSEYKKVIPFKAIHSITITNNSDYSKLVVKQFSGEYEKLYVGFANLYDSKPILENDDQLDKYLTKSFQKKISIIKGIKTIKYENIILNK